MATLRPRPVSRKRLDRAFTHRGAAVLEVGVKHTTESLTALRKRTTIELFEGIAVWAEAAADALRERESEYVTEGPEFDRWTEAAIVATTEMWLRIAMGHSEGILPTALNRAQDITVTYNVEATPDP